ncbi:MAG: LD-carboxypeptidase [Chitinophagia bacterium]|nr:LD-carboxypeptidase [Chitinophagia bacterium]
MQLRQGATIGITCPSGYVAHDRVAYATEVLERWGYKVVLGKTVGNEFHYFSGTDGERAADLQQMLDDPAIDAILMGRGGYGMSRIIDKLDFAQFAAQPKWLCGFSDITVLHSHVQAVLGVPTLHSPMCGHFKPDTEHEDFLLSFRRALAGEQQAYTMPAHRLNRQGVGNGVVTGGNLSLLVHLTGSVSEVDFTGKLLFIEDLDEHLYHIDRMLMHLRRAGKLAGLAGLLVGGFTDMKDTERPFGQTVEELIFDKVRDYDYPVAFGFPAGHQSINYTLVLGSAHQLQVTAEGSVLGSL